MVRRAILADQPRTVKQQRHVQLRHTNVMYHLVKRPLEERRIDRKVRLHTARCQPSCHRNGMFLRNADIHHAARKTLRKVRQARTRRHSGGNRDDFFIRFRHFGQRFRHYLPIGRQCSLLARRTGFHIERRRAVEALRLILRRAVSISFFCEHMHDNRLIQLFDGLQCVLQCLEIMPVNRAEIMEAKAIEESLLIFAHEHGLDALFCPR